MTLLREVALRARRAAPVVLPALAFVLLATVPLVAQEALPGNTVASQSLRPYQFVFIAYALAWIFVLGWVIAVARRLGGLARRLGD